MTTEGDHVWQVELGLTEGWLDTLDKEAVTDILFAFGPVRMAIMLVGGNKASTRSRRDKWSGWYKKAIPEAEKLYRRHLEELEGGKDADW